MNEREKKPIEKTFPIRNVNRTAKKESEGIARFYYCPPPYIHKWWARRLSTVFRAIELYTLFEKGEVKPSLLTNEDEIWPYYSQNVQFDKTILDPMMGAGVSLIEGRLFSSNVIGCELNPVAWFLVKKALEPVDLDKLKETYSKLKKKIAPKIKKYYKTTCPKCGETADVMYYFWVRNIKCPNCNETVSLFKEYRVASSHSNSDFYNIFCPKCENLFQVENYREKSTCPSCGYSFTPSKGNKKGEDFVCPNCTQKYNVIEAIERQGKPKEEMYALEFYCSNCDKNNNLPNGRGYKAVTEEDKDLFKRARKEYERIKDQLPIPQQRIPEGHTTKAPLNHDYRFFKDLFNERQLLLLGKLLREIKKIKNQNIKELLLIAFSNALTCNNMACQYGRAKGTINQIKGIWKLHSYGIPSTPVENNIWGLKYGTGTFANSVDKVIKVKEFCKSPYVKYRTQGGKKKEKSIPKGIDAKLVNSEEELGEKGNSLLLCRSADYLPLSDKSVDAVITDPPYYQNIMYSELSDFHYVWLRLALKETYDSFRAELTPKGKEAVKNPSQDKGKEEYIHLLTSIFKESHRVLKDDGLMVFTFHHKKSEAWSSVLRSTLNAGFYIKAVYPIHSEMSSSTHIYEKKNITYDTIVVCRKREKKEKEKVIPWRELEDQIYTKSKEMAEQYAKKDGKYISFPDMSVIVYGQGLEIYSQHYPRVVKENGETLEAEEAVKKVREIADEHMIEERIRSLSQIADKMSVFYLLLLAGQETISYDALQKQLQGRDLSPDDFLDNKLFLKKRKLHKIKPKERTKYIKKLEPTNRLTIDKAHYLYYLFTSEKESLTETTKEWVKTGRLSEWIDEDVISYLKELAQETGKEAYDKVAEHAHRRLEKAPVKSQKELSEFEGNE